MTDMHTVDEKRLSLKIKRLPKSEGKSFDQLIRYDDLLRRIDRPKPEERRMEKDDHSLKNIYRRNSNDRNDEWDNELSKYWRSKIMRWTEFDSPLTATMKVTISEDIVEFFDDVGHSPISRWLNEELRLDEETAASYSQPDGMNMKEVTRRHLLNLFSVLTTVEISKDETTSRLLYPNDTEESAYDDNYYQIVSQDLYLVSQLISYGDFENFHYYCYLNVEGNEYIRRKY